MQKVTVKQFMMNVLGAIIVVTGAVFFFYASMAIPVMEVNLEGKCLRVLSEEGKILRHGCKLANAGKLATESRYVAK